MFILLLKEITNRRANRMKVIKSLKEVILKWDTPILISRKKSINGKYGEIKKVYPRGSFINSENGSVILEYCEVPHKDETKDDLYNTCHSSYTRVHIDVSLVDIYKEGK